VIWGLQEILYFLTKLRQIAFCWQRLRGFYPLYTKAVVRISDNIILQQGIGRKPVNNIGQIKKKYELERSKYRKLGKALWNVGGLSAKLKVTRENPSHRRFLLPTGLPHDNGTGPDLSRTSFYF